MLQKLIIDTDPGQDDAVAILLALASPEFDLLGITTVAGNVPLDLTTINARKICDLAGRPDCLVFVGEDTVWSVLRLKAVLALVDISCRRLVRRRSVEV